MSMIQSDLLLGQEGVAGYTISRSLRFSSIDSAFLSRTPASAGNRKTWTWAGWVKRSAIADSQRFFGTLNSGGTLGGHIQFTAAGELRFVDYTSGGTYSLVSSSLYRDPSAWYHIVCAFDTTQATASNRIKFYVNNVLLTAFSTANYHPQNTDGELNNATAHGIGRAGDYAGDYFTGYLADVFFIDGQALTPSSFGQFDANNVWQPKAFSGTYGTNGFKLDFADNSNNTAATLGKDTSGNGNNWTPTNLSVTAGAGNDSLRDSPTNGSQTDTGVGGEVSGNYCTWNPLYGRGTLSNGNLDIVCSAIETAHPATIFTSSGKWYWEILLNDSDYARVGICNTDGVNGGLGNTANSWAYLRDGRVFTNGSATSYGVTATNGDIINVALDIDAGRIWYGKNGTWMASGNPATGANPSQSFTAGQTLAPAVAYGFNTGSDSFTANFGAMAFAYTAPSGFKALCTANLPTPTIANGATAMDVALWTGNGSARSITGLQFSPDWVWLKSRSAGGSYHKLYDTVRGATKLLNGTNDTLAESTETQGLTAFNSDGFSLGTDANHNGSGATFVGWTWDAGSSTVTNTQGSITSQVRANASAGFSIVTYTGTGSAATIGHGLGVAPSLIIVKSRSNTGNWTVYTSTTGAGNKLYLNLTDASAGSSNWNSTAPTSTVFSVGSGGVETNINTYTYVAYCFAPVNSYSAFGSYQGNGSTDGAFIYTGHRSRWLLIRRTDSAENWILYDTARNPYNIADNLFLPNSSSAELLGDGSKIDILSNGFKNRTTSGGLNANGATYLYVSFAENPFQYARAR